MEQLIITLPDEIATQLKTVAKKTGVKPEEFLLASLQVKKIIFEYFEIIENEWNNFQEERNR